MSSLMDNFTHFLCEISKDCTVWYLSSTIGSGMLLYLNFVRIKEGHFVKMGWQRSTDLRAYVWIHMWESGGFLSDLFFNSTHVAYLF